MLRPFVPIHCVLASFAIGCGTADAGSGAQSSFTVRDSAGIRIVESTEPAEDRPWVISDSPLFQVGNVSGRPEYELYRVRGALRLSDGSIVIANGGTDELRWYSLTGEFLHSAGGTGEGPGEFLALASVFTWPTTPSRPGTDGSGACQSSVPTARSFARCYSTTTPEDCITGT